MNRTITAVPGVMVGHAQRRSRGWATGTTVVLVPGGATAGVDVRGAAPGTRETDLLRPEHLVQRINAICLTGGSAYGLAAAHGVMSWLEEHQLGFPIGEALHEVVPIVPAAVIFDLGRGGRFDARPDADFGYRAVARASRRPVRAGSSGAGTGARAGGLKGGVGSWAVRVPGLGTVGALAVVNAAGSVIDVSSGLPYAPDGFGLRRPIRSERVGLTAHLQVAAQPSNTTIGVVATDVDLTKAECCKLAQVAHDGLARAVRPAHAMTDGDTIFAISSGQTPVVDERRDDVWRTPGSRPAILNSLLAAAADAFASACTDAIVSASSGAGSTSYRDLCPSAFPSVRGIT